MTTTPEGPVDDTDLDPANTNPVDEDRINEPATDTDLDPQTGDPVDEAGQNDPEPLPGEDPGAL